MKDIFKILQHDGNNLEIVQYGGKWVLGCIKCGCTLFDEDNLDDITRVLETAKTEAPIIANKIIEFIDKITDLTEDELTRITENIISREKLFFEIDNVPDEELIYKVYRHIGNLKQIIDIHKTSTLVKLGVHIYGQGYYKKLVKKIIDKLKNDYSNDYMFLTKNDKLIQAGFYTIDPSLNSGLTIVSREIVKLLEEKFPAPTEKYVLLDLEEFYNFQSTYEDEENYSPKYYKYVYMMENDLFDFSNVDVREIIKDSIEFFSEYEFTNRKMLPLKKHFMQIGLDL